MSEFELSLSPEYASDWTIVDAVREIFQNALDQANTQFNNDMFFDYSAGAEELTIGNRSSVLEAKSLLLGTTTKAQDKETIGQFGEGYKIATLVLLRSEKTVKFYNYGAKEVWTPRFKNSKRYGARILVFDIKKHIWTSVPNNNLTIVVGGITPEEYQQIVRSNLNLQSEDYFEGALDTSEGRILLDSSHAGKVYVSGLFVTQLDSLKYGYDFKPQYLPLGRDRNMVKSIDITWETSRMWQEVGGDLMLDLIRTNAYDVSYVKNVNPNKQTYNMAAVRASAKEDFVRTHGDLAVPVTRQSEADALQVKYKDAVPIIVNETYKHVLDDGGEFIPIGATVKTDADEGEAPMAIQKLEVWYNSIKRHISYEKEREFETIFEALQSHIEELEEEE